MANPILKKGLVGAGSAMPTFPPKVKREIVAQGGDDGGRSIKLKIDLIAQGQDAGTFPAKLKKDIIAQGQAVGAPTVVGAYNVLDTTVDLDANGVAILQVFVPASVLPNLDKIEVWLQQDADISKYYSYLFDTFASGWNNLSFNPRLPDEKSADVPDLSIIDRIAIKVEATAVTSGLAFDNFRWFPGFYIEGGTTNIIAESGVTRVFSGDQALRMNKVAGFDFAGIGRFLDEPVDLTVEEDILEVSFFLEATDLPVVDYFEVVLDETPLWAQQMLFERWSYRYDGSVLPDTPSDDPAFLIADFEDISFFIATTGATLSANITEKTEGTQSLQIDSVAAPGLTQAGFDRILPTVTDTTVWGDKTPISFYIPSTEVAKLAEVAITFYTGLDFEAYGYVDQGGAITSGWNHWIVDLTNPLTVSGTLDRAAVTQWSFGYILTTDNTAVNGFLVDNFRSPDWVQINTGGATVAISANRFIAFTGTGGAGVNYFERRNRWGNTDDVWFQTRVRSVTGAGDEFGVQVIRNNLQYDIRINLTELITNDGLGGLEANAVDFSVDRTLTVSIDGQTNQMTIEVEGLSDIVTTSATQNLGNPAIRFGKIDSSASSNTLQLEFVHYLGEPDNLAHPFRFNYVAFAEFADVRPFDANADPVWSRVGSSARWTTSNSICITSDPGVVGPYYCFIDTVTNGAWAATKNAIVVIRARQVGQSIREAWGWQFNLDSQAVQFYLANPAGINEVGFGIGGGLAWYTGHDVESFQDYRVRLRWADSEADLWIGDQVSGTWLFIATTAMGAGATGGEIRFGRLTAITSASTSLETESILWDTFPVEVSSTYRSVQTPKFGWNTFRFNQTDPTATVGTPTRTAIERYAWRIYTLDSGDTFSSPVVDAFRISPDLFLAKGDFYADDGTIHWEGRVLSLGTLSKSLNEEIGNYSVSEAGAVFENVSTRFSQIYDEFGIGLTNNEIEYKYGLVEDVYDTFFPMFNGVLKSCDFENFKFKITVIDPMQGLFNRLPNQFVTTASFPEVPEDVNNYVAPLITGTVDDTLGALPAIPVGFEVQVVEDFNDKIDFDLRSKEETDAEDPEFVDRDLPEEERGPSRYLATIPADIYSDPHVLAQAVEDAMHLAIGAPPLPIHFEVTFDDERRRFEIRKVLGADFQIFWATGDFTEETARKILGFSTDQDSTGGSVYKSDIDAWNKFVIARHFCKEDTNAAAWIKEEFVGDKDSSGVIFDFEHVTSDGLKWTILTLPFNLTGRDEITVNISGFTDDDTKDGNIVTNPATALKIILVRYAEFPERYINDDGFTAAAAVADQKLLKVAGAQIEDVEWDTFIETYCKDFRMDLFANNVGKLTPSFFIPEILDQTAPPVTDILDIERGSFGYDPNFDSVVNRIRYEFRLNYATQKFARSDKAIDDVSIEKAGRIFDWPEGSLQLNWIRGGVAARRAVATTLNLFSHGIPIANFTLSYDQWDVDLTDKKNVSHIAGPVITGGERSYENRLHRVIAVEYNLDKFTVDVTAQDMFRLSERCFFLGDRDFPAAEKNWLSASGTNKILYGYLCNRDSGRFTDGEPGKKLC